MKKLLRNIGLTILFSGVLIFAFYLKNNEDLPTGKQGIEADALANKMLKAINHNAYKNTRFLEWNFRGKHFYKWDKKNDIVKVSWDKNKVILDIKSPQKSKVFIDGRQTFRVKLVDDAIKFFKNDRFWLVAPHTVFDNKTERRLVKHNSKDALLVTYNTGGNDNPKDSYLWILDDNGMPTSYKMWVSIIPTDGMDATWSDWITTASGTKLSRKHKMKKGEIDMGDVKGYN